MLTRAEQPALTCAKVDEAGKEKSGEKIEQPILAASFACEQMQNRPGNDAEAEAVGDGVGEGNQNEREKCGDGDEGIVPVNLCDGGQHERAHEDESRRCSSWRHDSDERRGDDGQQKKQAGDDGGYAGSATCGHACGGLHITGDSGGSGERAEDGGGCVGEENAVEPGNGVVGRDEAGALGDGHQRAEVVKEVDEKEDEDDFEQAFVDGPFDVELECCLGEGGDAASW